ncbi:MAG: IreB family regulatory phosphoprotein, partial [Clostridiales bacterium]|nr:IreB family regulatory phosphoprotein [Candidatus Coliplasma equi]
GYIISEYPTYITNYNNSRAIIAKIDRDELLRALVEDFINTDSKKKG